jgi:hypothetical protein
MNGWNTAVTRPDSIAAQDAVAMNTLLSETLNSFPDRIPSLPAKGLVMGTVCAIHTADLSSNIPWANTTMTSTPSAFWPTTPDWDGRRPI